MDAKTYAFIHDLSKSHYSEVSNLCKKLVSRNGDSFTDPQDIVQMVFELACLKADVVSSHKNPLGWLYVTSKMVYRKTTQSKVYKAQSMTLGLDEFPDIIGMEDIGASIAFDDALESATSIDSPIFEVAKKLRSDDYVLFQHMFVLQTDRETLQKVSRSSDAALRKRISRMRSRLWELWKKENQ